MVVEPDAWPALPDAVAVVQRAADAVAASGSLDGAQVSVTVALSDDAEVAALNAQFRGKPRPTNVLSFPAGRGAVAGFLGDIVLAYETVIEEAAAQNTSVADHAQHLVVHGILHLLGHDHETRDDAERMEALEISILADLGIANPYTGELVTANKE